MCCEKTDLAVESTDLVRTKHAQVGNAPKFCLGTQSEHKCRENERGTLGEDLGRSKQRKGRATEEFHSTCDEILKKKGPT